jgi:predicted nucleotidyltransferase
MFDTKLSIKKPPFTIYYVYLCIRQRNNIMDSVILEKIKATISDILPVSSIVLFGSRAKNSATNESDYDIMVIVPNEIPIGLKRDFRAKIRKELLKMEILSDILIESKKEIEDKRKIPGHIVKNAYREGIVL